ncbi:MAG: serine/threonine-protein kinase [Planctomycetia bacterium]
MAFDSTPKGGDGGPPRRFRDLAAASGLLSAQQIESLETDRRQESGAANDLDDPAGADRALAELAVSQKLLTKFQARELLRGRTRFTLGQYRILDEIGRGGMGQVFKAEHGIMKRVVAVKVLPHSKMNAHTEAAFQREIRMLAELDHENIVRALDAGYDGNVHYLVTEYIAGRDLRRQVERHGPLDLQRAALVIAQAARGLAYAHRRGFVHRDVKPGNLLVTRDGRVKLLDLGLAGSLVDADSMKSGRRVGTPGYTAPEQIRAPQKVGPEADIYGLGCSLFFAVTGQPPFPGENREEKERRQLSGPLPSVRTIVPQIDDAFAAVISAMMRPSPSERIRTADAVIEQLRPWLTSAPVPFPVGQKGSMMPSSAAASSSLSGFDPTSFSELQLSAETVRDAFELDDTSVAPPGSRGGGANRKRGAARGSSRSWLSMGRQIVAAVLVASPMAVLGTVAAAVAAWAVPEFEVRPLWGGLATFLIVSVAHLAFSWFLGTRHRR